MNRLFAHWFTPNIVYSFDKVLATAKVPIKVTLRVTTDEEFGSTDGTVVIVGNRMEEAGEIERQFIVAHEVGHIVQQHKEKKQAMYHQYEIAVAQVAPALTELSYQHEMEADAFALEILLKVGWSKDQVIDAFLGMHRTQDTVTHPSTARRVINLIRQEKTARRRFSCLREEDYDSAALPPT